MNPGKYIGLPAVSCRSKKEALGFAKDRFVQKVQSWKHAFHSISRHEVLIKVMAMDIPTYPTNFFFPITFCKNIDSMIAQFWWGQKDSKNKIHWCNWTTISSPKLVRGLGFHSLHDFNVTLLAKQFFLGPHSCHDLMARILRGRYFADGDAHNASKGLRASWAWSILLHGGDLIVHGARW